MNKESRFYIVLANPEVNDTTIDEYIGKIITHPAIFEEQDRAIARELAGRAAYRITAHLRDGAFGQMNAAGLLHAWNISKGRNMFQLKTSAACSMSEAINDLGYMHSILHNLFHDKAFKCKQFFDPPGPAYAKAKSYLEQFLHPASFATYWRCIVAMEPFMDKAFTQMTILSALKIGGFEGPLINIRTIMGHNVEFAQLPEAQSEKVLQHIESVFSNYWYRNSLIHEVIFDEVFEGDEDINTLSNKK